MYEQFIRQGILPEQVRRMPAFDVWMIQYAWAANHVNAWNREHRGNIKRGLTAADLNALLSPGRK